MNLKDTYWISKSSNSCVKVIKDDTIITICEDDSGKQCHIPTYTFGRVYKRISKDHWIKKRIKQELKK